MSPVQLLPSPLALEVAAGVRGLVAKAAPPDGPGAWDQERTASLWEALVAGGWVELADGPAPGAGGEMSLVDLCALAEEWGRLLVPLPFVVTLGVRRWMGPDRPAPGKALTYLVPEGAGLLPFGAQADLVALAHAGPDGAGFSAGPDGARTSGDPGIPPALDLREVGSLVCGPVDRYAPSLPLVPLAPGRAGSTEGAPRPSDPPGGPLAAPAAPAAHEWATLALAEAVGSAAEALAGAVGYATGRHQFGRPIGSFQALKHKMADMHRDVEFARSACCWFAAEPAALARRADLVLSQCLAVGEAAVHVHGGFGFTAESTSHRYLRHIAALARIVQALAPAAGSVQIKEA